jgi:hypothetical protein
MMVTRVISYYLSMLVNGIYTVLYHVLAAPPAKEKGSTPNTSAATDTPECVPQDISTQGGLNNE